MGSLLFCLIVGTSLLAEGAPVSSEDSQKAKKEAVGPAWNHGHQELRWNSQLSPVDIDIPYKRDGGSSPVDIHYQLSPVDIDIPYKRSVIEEEPMDDPPMAIFVPLVFEAHEPRAKKRNVDTTIVDLNTLERIMAAGRR